MHDVGARPRHAVEDDEAQRAARHVDAVAHRVGAQQAPILLGAEDVDQRSRVHPVDVLGEQHQPGLVERPGDAPMDGAQPGDRREQTEAPAAGGQEQLAVGGGDLIGVVALDVGHHQDPGARRVVEGRGRRHPQGGRRKVGGAGARLGGGPIGLGLAGGIAQTGRGDQHPVRRLRHDLGEGARRIDPVAVEAGVHVAPVEALDPEPVDELGRSLFAQIAQHGAPGAQRRHGAALEAAANGLDAQPLFAVQFSSLGVEKGGQRLDEDGDRTAQPGQGLLQRVGGLQKPRHGRRGVRLQAIGRGGIGVPRIDLLADEGEKGFCRPRRGATGDALVPAGGGQDARRLQSLGEGFRAAPVAAHQVLDAPLEAARPRAPLFLGAPEPAPELGRLDARKMGRKRRVGGTEKMVSLVEHVARREPPLLGPAEGRLDHDQRVVGDHDVGAPRAADGAFDEAPAVVGARRIDALAPGIGEVKGEAAPDQVGQPGREVAAHHVPVAAGQRPAPHQAQGHGVLAGARRQPRHGLFHVEEAQVVLAALAHDHLLFLLGGIGEHPVELAVELALQVAGVGADPYRSLVLLRPDAGRRQVAQRLADAGAGLGEHEAGLAGALARREGGGDTRRVVGLAGPFLGAGAEHGGEPRPRLLGFHRVVAGRRVGGRLLPILEAPPHLEAVEGLGWRFGRLPFPRPGAHCQRRDHGGGPRPAAVRHGLGDGQGIGIGWMVAIGEAGEQRMGGSVEGFRFLLE